MESPRSSAPNRFRWVALLGLVGMLAGCKSLPFGLGSDGYTDLGDLHYQVSTESTKAQLWFDRGLTLCWGFNHEEAIRCFQRALEQDPEFAMAHWGIAFASGPNINNTEMDESASKFAYDHATKAAELASGATEVERRLIEALGHRYSWPAPSDRTQLNVRYSDAMREVYNSHSDDVTVSALFADSLMVLRPWKLWAKDGTPAPEAPEIVATLEKSLATWPDHPGLCHFYIHAVEMSPEPEKALPYANRLRNRVPGSGHLVHMPSHIDILVGDYENAIRSNQKAILADTAYTHREGKENFYTLYRVHNYHFVVYAAMFDGQRKLALETSRELVRQIPDSLMVNWADFLEAFVQTPYHVMVRFGMWDEILAEPRPGDDFPVTRAAWHYARGVAYATKGHVPEAEAEKRAFDTAYDRVPESRLQFNNSCRTILSIAGTMLEGEIEYRKGNHARAFELLREGVRKDDALNYDEPWGWMQPVRHALGALLLEQGQVDEAMAVYEADLDRHPNNVWALHGLAECLRKTGREQDAKKMEAAYGVAMKRADVKIQSSCYCRVGTAQ